jgi:hypothetical protein
MCLSKFIPRTWKGATDSKGKNGKGNANKDKYFDYVLIDKGQPLSLPERCYST